MRRKSFGNNVSLFSRSRFILAISVAIVGGYISHMHRFPTAVPEPSNISVLCLLGSDLTRKGSDYATIVNDFLSEKHPRTKIRVYKEEGTDAALLTALPGLLKKDEPDWVVIAAGATESNLRQIISLVKAAGAKPILQTRAQAGNDRGNGIASVLAAANESLPLADLAGRLAFLAKTQPADSFFLRGGLSNSGNVEAADQIRRIVDGESPLETSPTLL